MFDKIDPIEFFLCITITIGKERSFLKAGITSSKIDILPAEPPISTIPVL
jgi:hypothetical protein